MFEKGESNRDIAGKGKGVIEHYKSNLK